MCSASPQPAHGSSKATGGIFRGQRETFRLADAENETRKDQVLPAFGIVMVYVSGINPGHYKPKSQVAITHLKIRTFSTLGPILKELGNKFLPIKSKFLLFWSFISISN